MQRYDATAEGYTNSTARNKRQKYQKALQNLPLNQEDAVLDVGCGSDYYFLMF
jgi:cyclopropane fatty-acyl-phospholipid synthase-like methyltransferase